MGRRNVMWVIIFTLVIIACMVFILIFTNKADVMSADIYVSDRLEKHIDDISGDDLQTYTLKTGDGYNKICWQNNQIWVEEADCDNQTCVNFGELSSEGLSIICAPHKVVITLTANN